ncbi:MAG: response regulator [Chthoniobacteraceae bacterium]|jgi:DNA-binding NtrC family response regulator
MATPILIVDDEPNVRLMYRCALAGFGYELYEAPTAEAALEEMRIRKHDVGIFDLRLPGMSGLELLEQMHALGIMTPVAFVTAYGEVPNAVRAMELGAIDFLPKPPTPDQIRETVHDIILRHSAGAMALGARDFEYYLRSAKRAINLRDFPMATKYLIKALDLNPGSRQAINLVGVLIEMRQEHESAARS